MQNFPCKGFYYLPYWSSCDVQICQLVRKEKSSSDNVVPSRWRSSCDETISTVYKEALLCLCLFLLNQKASSTRKLHNSPVSSIFIHSQLVTILKINKFDYPAVTMVSFTKTIASALACVGVVTATNLVRKQLSVSSIFLSWETSDVRSFYST